MQGPNGKYYRSFQIEGNYAVVGKPGSHLTHFSPEDDKGRTATQKSFDSIRVTELEDRLAIIGTDKTACIIGKYNEGIRHLEILVSRPLQRIVCLLHTNELLLRRVLATLDGSTSSPNTFTGFTRKCLHKPVSTWSFGQLDQIPMSTSCS